MSHQSNVQYHESNQTQVHLDLSKLRGPSTFDQIVTLLIRYLTRCRRHYVAFTLRALVTPLLILGIPLGYMIIRKVEVDIPPNKDQVFIFYLLFFWPMLYQINVLVNDKDTHFKSLMFMMGLKRKSYYISSFLAYFMSTTHLMVLLMVLFVGYSYANTPAMITISVFTLFQLQLASILYLLASLLPSTKFSLVLIPILVLDYFLGVGMCTGAKYLKHSSFTRYFIFMGGISPFQGLRNYADSYMDDGTEQYFHIDDLTRGVKICETNGIIALTQICWFIVLCALSAWFEEICPWKTDTEIKRPFFFLERNQRVSDVLAVDTEDKCMIGERYFEKCPQNRPTGLRMINLKKSYKNKAAVNGVSMRIFRGETTLLLGHNGAGKTTLMNMLLGQLSVDEGRVERPSDCGLGVCPQSSIVDESQTVYEHLRLFSAIKASNWDKAQRESHIRQVLQEVGLALHAKKHPGELSGGMLRKLSLGMALVGGSEILILDEPSSGLDPDSRVFIWNAIRRTRANKTVLLSSQHMEEADYLGDRIAIMSEGRIVCCGSSLFLKELFGSGYKLRIECLASKKNLALELIRRFFPTASIEGDDHGDAHHSLPASASSSPPEEHGNQDAIISLNIALTPNRRDIKLDDQGDDEMELICLLEFVENNKTPIRSHGLKGSSIEDVLLNTNRYFTNDDCLATSQNQQKTERVDLQIDTTERLIDFILRAPRDMVSKQDYLSSQMKLLKALLIKNVLQYKADWMSFICFRILLPCLAIYICCREIYNGYPNTRKFRFLSMRSRLMFALPIIAYVNYPIVERCSKFKSMIQTSNANYRVYWLSHLISDVLSSSFILIVAANICLPLAIPIKPSVPTLTVHSIVSIALFLYSIAGALLAYNVSLLVKSANLALAKVMIPININMGFFLWCSIMAVFEILAYPDSARQGPGNLFWIKLLRRSDKFFVSILPQDSFVYITYGLRSEGYYVNEGDDFPDDIFCPMTHGFIALICQITILSTTLVMLERFNFDLRSYLTISRYVPRFRNSARRSEHQQLDHDVVEESVTALKFVNSTHSSRSRLEQTFSLVAGDLCKSYRRGVPVIDHLSFTVKSGECFGLLGVNGAGKSTTFSMLVADLNPESGKILLNGHSNRTNLNKYRSQIAYDPQANPQISLTCTQTLTLMARLRLVSEHVIPEIVDATMQVLDMSEHSDKLAKNLSGGTKRKLALAMSLIGNPSFLALDEPTAGVDPIARRKIWLLLKTLRTKKNVSIVISSHAMEECEAICDRISIMARGKLRCLGSFLHLQSKYALGCNVKISLSGNEPIEDQMNDIVEDLRRRLELAFRSAVKLDDTNENSAIFSIECNLQRSKLFKIMRNFCDKYKQVNYIINDTSLEDVFKKIANENNQ